MKFGAHKSRSSRGSGRLVTEAQQSFSFTRRALFLGGVQGAVGVLLAGRMAYLSIFEHDKYQALAEANRARSMLIPPRRGWIVDRRGQPIAVNRSDFRVDLIPDLLTDRDAEIALVTKILALSRDDLDRLNQALDDAAGFQPVQVVEDLDYERFAQINLRLPDLPGLIPARGFSRFYPAGAAVAHLCGYVGSASAEDYKKDHDALLITPGFKIGKQGLEKIFDRYMRGQPGAKRSEVTARGKLVRDLTTRAETPGETLHLTIDAGLQTYVAERMGPESGSAVMIDCTNGDILAMVSMPAFDPNSFSRGVSQDEWNMLSANDHLPLLNKTVQGLYPPGSTVKPMNALALLEAGVSPDDRVVCSGQYRVGNSFFHCWKHGGHGAIDMHRAIAQSCDIYFYQMARRVGTPAIAAMARRLGLGEKYAGLPVTSQRYGTVPDPAWKQHRYHKDWTVSDTLNSSIGQGYTLVNPLQVAVMAARIASGRTIVPRLVHRTTDRPAGSIGIAPDHLALVHQAMGVVVGPGGTANAARLPLANVRMAGKTGSAQVHHISMADRASGHARGDVGAWRLRDHGLFIAFAPVEQPRYAMGVVLEHGGHGSGAAVIARDAMTYLYDPDKAGATLAKLQKGWGGDIAARMVTERQGWQAAQAAQKAADAEAAQQVDNAADPAPDAAASAVAPPLEGSDNMLAPATGAASPGNAADE